MKKVIALIITGLFIAVSSTVYAHPPLDIVITYNTITKTLQAVIVHQVDNPKAHFIKKVDVALNGQKIIEHKISKQDNSASQAVLYLIPDAKDGDLISVEAYCSVSGQLKRQIKVTSK